MMKYKKLLWWLVCILSLSISLWSIRFIVYLSTGYPEINGIADKYTGGFLSHFKILFDDHKSWFLTHVIGGLLALGIGPFQFSRQIRIKKPMIHKGLGFIYISSVLAGGIGGVMVGFHAFGDLARVGFITLAVLWLTTLYFSVYSLIKKDFVQHENWMFLNFALTFASVTLRLELGILMGIGLSAYTAYQIVSWLCWIPNLIIAIQLKGLSFNFQKRYAVS